MEPSYVDASMHEDANFTTTIQQLKRVGITFSDGLSRAELINIEKTCEFRFPPDLKQFLSTALPVGVDFPNWRSNSQDIFARSQAYLLDGILFDVEQGIWSNSWGQKPESDHAAMVLATQLFKQAPIMIPICGHRFLPSTPYLSGNPVYSIVQTDIILYGMDLPHYLEHVFLDGPMVQDYNAVRKIEFWHDLLR